MGSAQSTDLELPIYCIAGDTRSKCFRRQKAKWQAIPHVSSDSGYSVAVSHEKGLYLIGDREQIPMCLDASLRWRFIAPLRIGSTMHTAASCNGHLLVMGGRSQQDGNALARVEIYKSCWRDGPPMSIPRCKATSVVFDNCVYTFGGECGGALPSAEYLDLSPTGAEAMDTMNSLPMLRFFPPGLLTVVSSYLHSGGWIPIASPPTVRSYHSAVVVEDKILLLGGRSPYYREEHGVEEYCPRTNQWRTLSWKLPQPRICMAVHYSAATQHLILMGDLTLTRAVMDTRCVARNMVTGVWSEIFTLPLAVGSCSLVALHNNNVNLFLAALFL